MPETKILKVRDKNANGWYKVEVDHLDHPDWTNETLDTKKQAIAEAASELVGEPVELDFTHSKNGDWNNFWLNGVLPKKPKPQFAPAEEPASAREFGYKTPLLDAWRMCLCVGGELAIRTAPDEGLAVQQELAYKWAKFFVHFPRPQALTTAFEELLPEGYSQFK